MNGYKYYFCCLVLSFVISCEKGTIIHEEIEYINETPKPCYSKPAPIYFPGEMQYGRISGLKNCLPFMASAEIEFYTYNGEFGVDLIIQTFENWEGHYVRKELILVGALAHNKGTYSMYFPSADAYQASYSTLQDFDVFEDIFEIDESYTQNEITFEVINRSEGYAKGYFNCRFLLASNTPSGQNPDTVTFNQCYFESRRR